jgi:hypothetical protein
MRASLRRSSRTTFATMRCIGHASTSSRRTFPGVMLGVAVRAQHLALRELGQDALAAPSSAHCVRNTGFLRLRVRVMKLQAPRMVLTTATAEQRTLELYEPVGDVVAPRELRLALAVHELGRAPLVFRPRVPRSECCASPLWILRRHPSTVSTHSVSGKFSDNETASSDPRAARIVATRVAEACSASDRGRQSSSLFLIFFTRSSRWVAGLFFV